MLPLHFRFICRPSEDPTKKFSLYQMHCHNYTFSLSPISTHAEKEGHLVVVYPPLALLDEPVLLPIGPDAGCTHNGLLEVGVDQRTCHRVKTLQLMRRSHVEALS